jgi:osmoprotectant transport system ATP-binding protein
LIRFEGVGRSFGPVQALRGLDLEVGERELCVLVGPSGAGKSTALRMINRLVEPSEGRVLLDGRDLRSINAESLRRGIGYVIQSVGLFPHLTVSANVSVVPELLGWDRARIASRSREMLELVGLDPDRFGPRYPSELSGGEAQRVGVARALASDPPILLMDEPFSAVDPINRLRLQNEFLSIQRRLRKTVVFVTHDVDEAIRLADRIAVLRAGSLVQYDAPEALLDHPVDAFIAGFLGSDRALKRLSRRSIGDWMRPAASARVDSDLAALLCGTDNSYWWIVDPSGKLLGSLDRDLSGCSEDPREILGSQNVEDMAVRLDASLKDALSAMLGTSARTIPVVDGEFRLVGEIGLADIERASERDGRGPR